MPAVPRIQHPPHGQQLIWKIQHRLFKAVMKCWCDSDTRLDSLNCEPAAWLMWIIISHTQWLSVCPSVSSDMYKKEIHLWLELDCIKRWKLPPKYRKTFLQRAHCIGCHGKWWPFAALQWVSMHCMDGVCIPESKNTFTIESSSNEAQLQNQLWHSIVWLYGMCSIWGGGWVALQFVRLTE